MKKPTTEYRWEAVGPDGKVFKRGPIRTDLAKTKKYADELTEEIAHRENLTGDEKRFLARYWDGAKIRIITRTITPWTEIEG